MKKSLKTYFGLILIIIFSFLGQSETVLAQESDPIVRAVLFYSPSCPHCTQVREEFLPLLQETYGEQVQLLEIDTSTEAVELYFAAVEDFEIPPARQGVPAVIVKDQLLVGSFEIPDQLPGIIDEGLESGGISWPEITGLEDWIPDQFAAGEDFSAEDQLETPEVIQDDTAVPQTQTPDPMDTVTAEPGEQDGSLVSKPVEPQDADFLARLAAKFRRDLAGNTVAVIVLLAMLGALVAGLIPVINTQSRIRPWPLWSIPVLSVLGLGVAGYMSFVEVTSTAAVCGPVGDCNTVQSSPYAMLLGFLPVGVLGLLGYLAILAAWLGFWIGRGWLKDISGQALWLFSFFGLLFSIYLTFLEPFVIGATCAWCLSSAVIITLQYLAASSWVVQTWENS
jgi:uncharacterized membrane protein